MVSGAMPEKPGYYWAKWKIAADGTHEAEHLTPAKEFEIVQVNANCSDWKTMKPNRAEYDERLSVAVPGVRETQWPQDFVWGDFVADLRQ